MIPGLDAESPAPKAYLGLGSNLANELGDPIDHLRYAVEQLKPLGELRLSALYASAPMGPADQPEFLNAVAEISLSEPLTPEQLHDLTHDIELARRRIKTRHWGERSLDIDLLYMSGYTRSTARLNLPHAGVLERNFVWVPLLELAPDLRLGNTSQTLKDWALIEHGYRADSSAYSSADQTAFEGLKPAAW